MVWFVAIVQNLLDVEMTVLERMTLTGLYMTITHKIAAFTIQILSIHLRNDQSHNIHTANMCTYTASANIYAYKKSALSSDYEMLFLSVS